MEKDALIFIVDDDEVYHGVMKAILRKLGYINIECYYSGEECIDALKRGPKCIFLDYNLDGINGYDTLCEIRKSNEQVKVVIVSGQEKIDVALATLKVGAFDYIIKDKNLFLSMNELLNYIEEASPYNQLPKTTPVSLKI